MREKQIQEAFDEIKADDALKQKTLHTILARSAPKRRTPARLILTAAVILLAMIGGIFSYTVPVYAISLDEESSVELQVNMYQKVVSVTTYDTDLLTPVNNMNYTDAIAAILDGNTFASPNVSITVAGKDQAGCQKMIQNLQQCNSQCMAKATYNTADPEMIAQAKECGMSLGKYKMYLLIKEMDPSFTLEEAQNMTIQQMHQKMGKGMGKMMK
jgi:hypothetical protein